MTHSMKCSFPNSIKISFLFLFLPIQNLSAQGIDLDRNGFGDLWSKYYDISNLSPETDDDGDGLTNLEEEIAGTDPLDPTSNFDLTILRKRPFWQLEWPRQNEKSYQIEISSDLNSWYPINPSITSISGTAAVELSLQATQFFGRVNVFDRDEDNDGLSAWEEAGLGYSDSNTHSNGNPLCDDYSAAVATMSSQSNFQFYGKSIPGSPLPDLTAPATLAEASRFLQQATMGADYEMIQAVADSGIPAWIDSQMVMPVTSHVQTGIAMGGNTEGFPDYISIWTNASLSAPDVLRQRVAFALSEIFVVSQTTDDLLDNSAGVATYYDILLTNAFGNFRDLLDQVTTSPAMGHFLSHVKNRPTDPANTIFPDENYAREVMQLFSIGLWQLHIDGSRMTDANGAAQPTYDNSDIREFARVFTGMTYNPQNPDNGTPHDDGDRVTDELTYLGTSVEWMGIEMLKFEPMHETGIKHLLNEQTTNGTLQQDLDAAIDNLFNHPNVGPFIGRLLIQRLIKSNPSPGYIARVAMVFNDNGSGVRGDLGAVIRAILLDHEARDHSHLSDPSHGKLREPLLRQFHILRAFNPSSSSGIYPNMTYGGHGQIPMLAPSVFNYYLPDHLPFGPLKDNILYGPEFQITTANTSINLLNYWFEAILSDALLDSGNPYIATMDYSDEIALASDLDALLDRLDILLVRSQMSSNTRTAIHNALVGASNAGKSADEIARFAVVLITSSPDFAILR
ncbi:MAG: DUF1800 family protein [Verrucomicrobiota bacterium]